MISEGVGAGVKGADVGPGEGIGVGGRVGMRTGACTDSSHRMSQQSQYPTLILPLLIDSGAGARLSAMPPTVLKSCND